MTSNPVYKIFKTSEWTAFEREGVFTGSVNDKRDGFIHLSTASQLSGTLTKHYTGGQAVMLAMLCGDDFGGAIKFEPSRGGDLFPHLYGQISRTQIKRQWLLQARADASYELPDLSAQDASV